MNQHNPQAVGLAAEPAAAIGKYRWTICGLLFFATTINYLDRQVLSLLAPAELVSLAYDAGSVTTGVLSAPVMLALALGLSSVLGERSVVSDGFGLLGLASTGPIIPVLLIGLLRS